MLEPRGGRHGPNRLRRIVLLQKTENAVRDLVDVDLRIGLFRVKDAPEERNAFELRLKEHFVDCVVLGPPFGRPRLHTGQQRVDVIPPLFDRGHPDVREPIVPAMLALVTRGDRVRRVAPFVILVCECTEVGRGLRGGERWRKEKQK